MRRSGERGVNARILQEAVINLRRTLEMLDCIDAPPDIGAHIDRAICRLEDLQRGQSA